jgi:predicted phage-related endonuclease
MLTNAAFGAVCVMRVDAYNLLCPILEIQRHPEAEAKIIAAVRQFWGDVAHGREPGPDYGKDASLLPILAPRAIADKTIDLSGDNELPALLDEREQMKEQISAFEKRCDQIETEIKFKIREAERAIIPGWSVTWKNQHRNQYLVPEKDIRVLRIVDKREESGA